MKKIGILTIFVISFISFLSTSVSAEMPGFKKEVLEKKIKKIEIKLNNNQKLTEKKINTIITKKQEVIKQKEAKERAEQEKIEQEIAIKNENSTKLVEQEQSYIGENEQIESDVVTSASETGREIGQKNREYGQKLSDPNLSKEERRQIIEEKKNYNKGRNR